MNSFQYGAIPPPSPIAPPENFRDPSSTLAARRKFGGEEKLHPAPAKLFDNSELAKYIRQPFPLLLDISSLDFWVFCRNKK
jgi:hypothetical protein